MDRKIIFMIGIFALAGIIAGMTLASAARSSVTVNVGGGGAKGASDVLRFSPGQVAISEGGSITYQWVSSFHAVVLERGNCADSALAEAFDGVSPDPGCGENDDDILCFPQAASPAAVPCTPALISALAPGKYEFYCPIGDHHLKGMDGIIKVLP